MDDAPRAGILKTAFIVGLLVVSGAGCSSETTKAPVITSPTPQGQSEFGQVFSSENSYVWASDVTSGCFDLPNAKALLKNQQGADKFFEALERKQYEGWEIRLICVEKLSTNEDHYYVASVSLAVFDVSNTTALSSMLGAWDQDHVDTVFSPIVTSTKEDFRSDFFDLKFKKQWVPTKNEWTYSVLARTGHGSDPNTSEREIYEFFPCNGTLRVIYSCPRRTTPGQPSSCRSYNSF